MPIDIQQLITELENSINNAENLSPEELLLLSKYLNEVSTDRIVSVPTVDDLPLLYDEVNEEVIFPAGNILFVESLNVLVISSGTKWIGLDGRVLREDNPPPIQTLYAWGTGFGGRLGDNTTIDKSSPVTVVGGITNWSEVSATGYHSLGLTSDGILYAWGLGADGALGDGTTINRSSPVTVVGGITNWSEISAGGFHSLGLTSTGIIYSWGVNFSGYLGDGTTMARSSPVTVISDSIGWKRVSAGNGVSFAISTDDVLFSFGFHGSGQLGDGTTISKSSPVTVVGGIPNWSKISPSKKFDGHTLGLTSDGIIYAWGSGSDGRLGTNDTINRSSPVTVVGGITNWSGVGAGYDSSFGLTDTGVLYAWGGQWGGQLGTGDTIPRSSPVTVVGGITNWNQIAPAASHTLALTSTGTLYGWGANSDGYLGDNTVISKSSPVTVVGGITNWSQVIGGRYHSLAISTE